MSRDSSGSRVACCASASGCCECEDGSRGRSNNSGQVTSGPFSPKRASRVGRAPASPVLGPWGRPDREAGARGLQPQQDSLAVWPFPEPRCHFTRCMVGLRSGVFFAGTGTGRTRGVGHAAVRPCGCGVPGVRRISLRTEFMGASSASAATSRPASDATAQHSRSATQDSAASEHAAVRSACGHTGCSRIVVGSGCAAAAAFHEAPNRLAAPAQQQPHFGCAAGRELFLLSLHPTMHGYRPGILHHRSEDRELLPGSVQAQGLQRSRLVPERSINGISLTFAPVTPARPGLAQLFRASNSCNRITVRFRGSGNHPAAEDRCKTQSSKAGGSCISALRPETSVKCG